MAIIPPTSHEPSKLELEQFPKAKGQITCQINSRNQIALSRLHYFNELEQSSQTIVPPDCSLIQGLVRTFQEKKITPGFWTSSEKLESLNNTAAIVDDIRKEFERISCNSFAHSKTRNLSTLTSRVDPLNGELENITTAILKLPYSDSLSLFSQFFFGDFWLRDRFSPQEGLGYFFSHDDLLFDKSKMTDLIASALNSELCLRSKMLSEAVWIQTLQKNRYFPVILPDQIPYRLLDIAHQTLKLDQFNLLSLSNGWAGTVIGAAAWAHRHPQISVNLISCDKENEIIQAQTHLKNFLRKHFQLPNFRSEQIVGDWDNIKTLKKAQEMSGSKGRIIIGSLPPLNRHLFKKQMPQFDHGCDDAQLYCLWRRHYLEPAIAHSSLYLHSCSSPSMAFWHISRKIRKIDVSPLSDSARIWVSCGLLPLCLLVTQTADPLGDERGNANATILVVGNQINLSSSEFTDRFVTSVINAPHQRRTEDVHRVSRRSKPLLLKQDDVMSAHSSFALSKRSEPPAAQVVHRKRENPSFENSSESNKRPFDEFNLVDKQVTNGIKRSELTDHCIKTTPRRKISPIALAMSEGNCPSQLINTVGPLQNQLSVYPSCRPLFPSDDVSGQILPSLDLAFSSEISHRDSQTANEGDLFQTSSEQPVADGTMEDQLIDQSSADDERSLDLKLDLNQTKFSDYLHKDRADVDNIKKLKEVYPALWKRIKHMYDPSHPDIVKNFDEMMTKYPNRYKNYRAKTYQEIKNLPTLYENDKPKKPELHCLDNFIQCFRERYFVHQLPRNCGSLCALIKNKQQKFVVCGREFF